MNIKIEEIRKDKIDDLLNIRMEVLSHVFKDEIDKMDDKSLNEIRENNRNYYLNHLSDNSHVTYIARIDDDIIACGGICIYDEMPSPDNISGKCGYIMNVYVKEQYRGKNIATSIVEKLINDAKELNITKIYLETTHEARKLYEKLGFRDMGDYMIL